MKPVRIRWSDLPKYHPITFVIKKSSIKTWNKRFGIFDAFFIFDDKKREFEFVFPHYVFLRAYRALPIKLRKETDHDKIEITINKLERGRMNIINLKKWIGC